MKSVILCVMIFISGVFLKKSFTMSHTIQPPIAKRIPFEHCYHGERFEDPYHWLRQKDWSQEKGVTNPDILDYLKQENAFTENFFNHNKDTVDSFYKELSNLIDIDDESYPISQGEYSYFIKTLKGQSYNQHFRKNKKTGKIELLFDENIEAQKTEYFRLGFFKVSKDHRYIAMTFDTDGSERYVLHIYDSSTKTFLPIQIKNVSSNGLVWNNDQTRFYFQKVDDQWRSNTVYYYDFVDPNAKETLIFEEKDTTNHVGIYKTSDDSALCIGVGSATDNVIYVQDINKKEIALKTPFKRQKNILYSLDSQGDNWIVLTNDKGPHKRVLRFDKNAPTLLESAIPIFNDQDQSDIYLTDIGVYKNALVILGKKDGLPILHIEKKGAIHPISLNYKSFTLDINGNDYDDDYVHLSVSSMVQPVTDVFLDFETLSQKTMHTRSVPNYNPDDYITDRLEATSNDGVKVPYTLAYKKDICLGNAPVYLYGYGSYGYPLDPDFRASFLPLMNKGYIVVMAHIRGGGDLGRQWYEAAKFKTKKKTFEDFISCAHDLILKGYTQKGNITICGGSAGGMLMGACLNMEPDLFKSAIAMVPFVDVVNSMMDETLPLTPGEFTEWGNPKEKDFFEYMKTYSPYDNVKAMDYPALYVTAGLNDPRVTYWEPAKWVAKLRSMKTDKNILLLETEMGAGHGGPSGKLNALMEIAKRYTFIMKTPIRD